MAWGFIRALGFRALGVWSLGGFGAFGALGRLGYRGFSI